MSIYRTTPWKWNFKNKKKDKIENIADLFGIFDINYIVA